MVAKLNFAQRILGGGVFLAGGAFMLALGFGLIDTGPGAVFAPLWIIALCGVVFVFAGLAISFGLTGEPNSGSWRRRAASHAVFIAILLIFAVISAWLAFGEGTRNATTETSLFGFNQGGEASETELRLWGGAFAVILALATGLAAFHAWRDLFGRRK